MPQIILNFDKLKTVSRLLTCSLLVALPSAFYTSVLAEPLAVPTPNVSQSANSSEDAILKKLIGKWENKDSFGRSVNFIFAAEGKMFLIMEIEKKSVAYPLKYEINSTPNPIYLDINLPDNPKPVLTIFDFTADGQMRLQIEGTDPGQPRPTSFSANVSVFKKVSDSVDVPQNVEVINSMAKKPEIINPTSQEPASDSESEPKRIVRKMNHGQQDYFLDKSKFAKTIQELKIGINSLETENYRYRIISQNKSNENVMHTATAKKPNLKSYTGVVFITKIKDEKFTSVAICETVKPTNKAPLITKIPTKASEKFQCPNGSILSP